MTWTISDVEDADMAECAVINRKSFINSDINRYIRPHHRRLTNVTKEEVVANTVKRLQSQRKHIMKKATNADGQIAGVAVWHRNEELKQYEPQEIDESQRDQELDPVAEAHFLRELTKADIQAVGTGRTWSLVAIATDPAFRGQGVASALIQWGLEQAKSEGMPTLLGSVPAAERLYAKHGFVKKGDFKLTYKKKDMNGQETDETDYFETVIMQHPA